MAIVFKTPAEVADEYLRNLKVLKPEVNIDQTDSDWYIRSRVVGGVGSGIYADQRKGADDAFPQSARREAVERHLNTYFNRGFNEAQKSSGIAIVTGNIGSPVTALTEFLYAPNGNTYQATETVILSATAAEVPVQSVGTGQSQNLLAGAELSISSPPAGIDSSAIVGTGGLGDGRDAETPEQAVERILSRIQQPPAGGTVTDYENFAKDSDPSVVSAKVVRFLFGLGTVGVYITAGTTDIDAAIEAGDAVVRVPSDALIEEVQAYIDAVNPLTDCATVVKPNEVGQNVTVRVHYSEGMTGASIMAGQTLTLNELLEREVHRALYKVPIGGRRIGANGYVLASEIEETIDMNLSASPYSIGSIVQAVVDRQVQDLSATGSNRLLKFDEIVMPATVTIQEF